MNSKNIALVHPLLIPGQQGINNSNILVYTYNHHCSGLTAKWYPLNFIVLLLVTITKRIPIFFCTIASNGIERWLIHVVKIKKIDIFILPAIFLSICKLHFVYQSYLNDLFVSKMNLTMYIYH